MFTAAQIRQGERALTLGVVAAILALTLCACSDSGGRIAGPGDGGQTELLTVLPADSALAACIRAAAVSRGVALDSAGLATLTELAASNREIASLEGVGVLRGLQMLDLSRNHIADLTPLAAVCSLRALDLAQNRITEITALAWAPR